MKRFAITALSILTSFVCACAAYAQGDAAGLIQKDTVSVIKVDLSKIDTEVLSGAVQKIGSGAIDYFVEDADQAKEMKEMLPIGSLIVAQGYNEFIGPVKETGADAVYFVVDQPEDASETLYPYLAVSTKDMTDAQKKELRDAFAKINGQLPKETATVTLKYRFERNGYFFVLIVPTATEQDEVKAYIKKRFAKIAAVECAEFVEGFDSIPSNAIVSGVQRVVVNAELVEAQLEQAQAALEQLGSIAGAEDFGKSIESIVDTGNALAEKVEYTTFYLALDEPELAFNLKAKSEDDAKEYAAGLKEMLSTIFNAAFEFGTAQGLNQAEENGVEVTDEQKEQLAELKVEAKKAIDLFANFQVDGQTISWKMNGKFWTDNEAEIKAFVDFVKGLAEKDAAASGDDEEEEDVLDL